MSREAWRVVGGLSEDLHIAMDYHLWAKLAATGHVPVYLPEEVAFFRVHGSQKTRPDTADYRVKLSFDRAWALYDALRIGRGVKAPPPDLREVEHLLESKVGAFCQILETRYTNGGWSKLGAATASAVLYRPNTTLRYLSSIFRPYIWAKFYEYSPTGVRRLWRLVRP